MNKIYETRVRKTEIVRQRTTVIPERGAPRGKPEGCPAYCLESVSRLRCWEGTQGELPDSPNYGEGAEGPGRLRWPKPAGRTSWEERALEQGLRGCTRAPQSVSRAHSLHSRPEKEPSRRAEGQHPVLTRDPDTAVPTSQAAKPHDSWDSGGGGGEHRITTPHMYTVPVPPN